ncbi:hypothetical protein CB1_000055008 [Camelus ferus]|nr:hypothetical protein CB1_000055008 [Camelus ferus]
MQTCDSRPQSLPRSSPQVLFVGARIQHAVGAASGRKGGHKGRARQYTSPEEIDAQLQAEKQKVRVLTGIRAKGSAVRLDEWHSCEVLGRKKPHLTGPGEGGEKLATEQDLGECVDCSFLKQEEEEQGEEGGDGAAGDPKKEKKSLDSDESEDEEDDYQQKRKGVEGLIDIENPNRVAQTTKKVTQLDLDGPKELSRREREEIEKQKAKERYMKMHLAGKTEQAKADLARLAIIRRQREEAARKKEEERKGESGASGVGANSGFGQATKPCT